MKDKTWLIVLAVALGLGLFVALRLAGAPPEHLRAVRDMLALLLGLLALAAVVIRSDW